MAIAAQETYYPKIVRVINPDKPKIVRILVPGPPGPSNHGDAVVSDYVKTGDGDDTFSFLRAIQTGRSVFVPKRTTPYLLDPTANLFGLNLRNLQQPLLEITGEGQGRSVLKWKGPTGLGDNDPLFWFKDAPMRLIFRGLTWDGNKDAFTGADDGGYTQNFVRFEVPSPNRQSELVIEDVEMINQRRVGLWIDEPPEGDVITAYLHRLADREGLLAASITDACQAVHVSGKGVDLTVRDFECMLSRDVTSLDPVTPADYGRAGLVVQIEDTPADPTLNTYRSRVSVIGAYGRNAGHGMGNTLGLVDVYSGGDTIEISNVRGDGVYGRLVCVKADAAQTIITDVIGRKVRGDNATGIAVFRSPTKGGNAQRNMHIQTVQVDDVSGVGSYGVLVDGASEDDLPPFFASAELLDLLLTNLNGSAILVRNCSSTRIRANIRGAAAGVSFSGMQETLDISESTFENISNTGISGFTFVRDNANLAFIANNNKFSSIVQRCYDLPPVKSFSIGDDTIDGAAIYLRWQGTASLSSVKGAVGRSVVTPSFRASGVDAGGFFWAQTNRFDNPSTFSLLNLTIANGAIDPVATFHYLSAEGGVDDDLDFVKLGFDGQQLFLQQASNAYKIRVRAAIASPPAGYGPIYAPSNRQLSNTRDIILLVCSRSLSAWLAFPTGRNSVAVNGSTAQRPTALLTATDIGYMFFDSTLGLPIFWNGAGWRKADGTAA